MFVFQKIGWCVSGGKKCSFFGKFGVFCFPVTIVLRFALLPYYQRITYSSNQVKRETLAKKTL